MRAIHSLPAPVALATVLGGLVAPAALHAQSRPVFAPMTDPREHVVIGAIVATTVTGQSFTLGDGTVVTFPGGPPPFITDDLEPGGYASVRYTVENGQNVLAEVKIQGPGLVSGAEAIWHRGASRGRLLPAGRRPVPGARPGARRPPRTPSDPPPLVTP